MKYKNTVKSLLLTAMLCLSCYKQPVILSNTPATRSCVYDCSEKFDQCKNQMVLVGIVVA